MRKEPFICEIRNADCNEDGRRLFCFRCGCCVCSGPECSQLVRWRGRRIRLCANCDQYEGLWKLAAGPGREGA